MMWAILKLFFGDSERVTLLMETGLLHNFLGNFSKILFSHGSRRPDGKAGGEVGPDRSGGWGPDGGGWYTI